MWIKHLSVRRQADLPLSRTHRQAGRGRHHLRRDPEPSRGVPRGRPLRLRGLSELSDQGHRREGCQEQRGRACFMPTLLGKPLNGRVQVELCAPTAAHPLHESTTGPVRGRHHHDPHTGSVRVRLIEFRIVYRFCPGTICRIKMASRLGPYGS